MIHFLTMRLENGNRSFVNRFVNGSLAFTRFEYAVDLWRADTQSRQSKTFLVAARPNALGVVHDNRGGE